MITITKDKVYRSNFSLKKTEPYSDSVKEIEVRDIVFYMGEDVELGEDVTFERIFDVIIFHKEFFNILFNSEMGGLKIDDFLSDYEQEFNLTLYQEYVLTIFWSGIVYEIDQGVEYYDLSAFEGFGKIDTRIDGEEYPISISLTPLSEFRSKLVIMDNTFEIQNENSYENELEVSFKANYRPFSVSNVFAAILREISYYGNPEQRNLSRREIERRGMEITKRIDDGSIEHMVIHPDLQDFPEATNDVVNEDSVNITYWDLIYPSSTSKQKDSEELVDNSAIAMPEESQLSLEEQLIEADEAEDYERASKIKKLIDRREKKRQNKK